MTAHDYCENAVKKVEETLAKEGRKLTETKKGKAERPHPEKYRPELDLSEELGDDLANRFQQCIGVLRWAVELGRIDIAHEVSRLSSFNCSPRRGHPEAVYVMFAHSKKCENSRMVFDYHKIDMDESAFETVDWEPFCGKMMEELPPKMPEPRGHPVYMTPFCDADHAGNMATRRSHTGLLMYLNNSPIN